MPIPSPIPDPITALRQRDKSLTNATPPQTHTSASGNVIKHLNARKILIISTAQLPTRLAGNIQNAILWEIAGIALTDTIIRAKCTVRSCAQRCHAGASPMAWSLKRLAFIVKADPQLVEGSNHIGLKPRAVDGSRGAEQSVRFRLGRPATVHRIARQLFVLRNSRVASANARDEDTFSDGHSTKTGLQLKIHALAEPYN